MKSISACALCTALACLSLSLPAQAQSTQPSTATTQPSPTTTQSDNTTPITPIASPEGMKIDAQAADPETKAKVTGERISITSGPAVKSEPTSTPQAEPAPKDANDKILSYYKPYRPGSRTPNDDPKFYGNTDTGNLVADLLQGLQNKRKDLVVTMNITGDDKATDHLMKDPTNVILSMGPLPKSVHQRFDALYRSALIEIPLAQSTKNKKAPYIVLRNDPMSAQSEVVKEFLRYLYSKEGQTTVSKNGFTPLSFKKAQKFALRYGVHIEAAKYGPVDTSELSVQIRELPATTVLPKTDPQ